MEIRNFDTHLEFWLNFKNEKPVIISEKWIYEFLSKINNINENLPLFIFAPSGIAGADINNMSNMSKEKAKEFSVLGNEMIKSIINYTPVVHGFFGKYLLGGGLEFALSCDVLSVTEECKIGFPEVTLGIIPGFFGIDLSYHRNNIQLYELLFTGQVLSIKKQKYNNIFNYVEENWEELEALKNVYLKAYENVSYKVVKKVKERLLYLKCIDTYQTSSELFSDTFEEIEQIEMMKTFLNRKKK